MILVTGLSGKAGGAVLKEVLSSAGNPYGENLFEIAGATASPAEVVGSWASEARAYDHRSNSSLLRVVTTRKLLGRIPDRSAAE